MASRSRAAHLLGPLRGYRSRWLRPDLIAGLTVWAVLVPESLAYATIAGVPPVVGLYAAVPALVLYALFGSSRHLIVGPMSATAALSAGIVAPLAGGSATTYLGFTAALALVVGLLGILAGIVRLGFIASFISEPVLKGFIVGLALTIIAGQLPKLLGVHKHTGDFFEQIAGLVGDLPRVSMTTLVVGMTALALVLVLRRVLPLVPGSLVVVLLGIVAVVLFDLDDHGVAVVGAIEAGLPRLGLPAEVTANGFLHLAGPGLGVLLVGFTEGLGAAKTYAARAGYDVDANRELLGLGAANLGAGLASGMVVNGSLSKTAVNGDAGARTRLSGLSVAALTVLTLIFLTSLFEQLPESVLAAVVIVAVIDLVDFGALRALYRVWTGRLAGIYGRAARADFTAAVAALLGVLVFDTLPGLFIGIAMSMLLLLYRASRPNVTVLGRMPSSPGTWIDRSRHPEACTEPDVVVVRIESGLFFANAEYVRQRLDVLANETGASLVVLDAQTIPFIDVTATTMLRRLSARLLRRGTTLAVARDIGQVRDVLTHSQDADRVPAFPTIDDAVAQARTTSSTPSPGTGSESHRQGGSS